MAFGLIRLDLRPQSRGAARKGSAISGRALIACPQTTDGVERRALPAPAKIRKTPSDACSKLHAI